MNNNNYYSYNKMQSIIYSSDRRETKLLISADVNDTVNKFYIYICGLKIQAECI